VPNQGQTAATVQFQAQSASGTVFFTSQEVVLALPRAVAEQPAPTVRVGFLDANPTPTITPDILLPGRVNDLRGDDPQQWRTDLPTYGSVVYEELYAGIDLRYDGHDGALKGTYTVAPGVDAGQIRWRYQGVEQVRIDQASGNLQVTVAADRVLTEAAPVAWQDIGEQRVPVQARYHVATDGTISFALGAYNAAYPLIIDPTIEWSTYLGGSIGTAGQGIAVDGQGNVYVTGGTASPDFPLQEPLQAELGGGFGDAFITKYSHDGQTLIYSTYFGGDRADDGRDIAVDTEGNVYIVGDSTLNVDPSENPCFPALCVDVFVAKLNAQGNALVYTTLLAGESVDRAGGIAVDAAGNAYVTGATTSRDFPTRNAFQPALNTTNCAGGFCDDAFLTKLNAQGGVVYSTYLGGSDTDAAQAVAVDAHGNVILVGTVQSEDFPVKQAVQPGLGGNVCGTPEFPQNCPDVFITKFRADGQALVFSTYLGGANIDVGTGVALDGTGNVYLAGYTQSDDFPTRSALQPTYNGGDCDSSPEGVLPCLDAFVTKLTPDGYALVYSTYFGGQGNDAALDLAVDRSSNVYLTGGTTSGNFPTRRAVQPQPGGGDCGTPEGPAPCDDAFITKLNAAGDALVYSTYLGGSNTERGQAITSDQAGTAYITGGTISPDFPTRNAQQPTKAGDQFANNAFVVKLRDPADGRRVYLPVMGR
jgi:hypothetical protein